jgi:hypothetical protein
MPAEQIIGVFTGLTIFYITSFFVRKLFVDTKDIFIDFIF